MSWTFPNTKLTKAAIIQYRLQTHRSPDGRTQTVIAHRVVGDTIWKVIETTTPGSPSQRHIGLDILMHTPNGYGYKDLYESYGPYSYDCPLSFLAMTPTQDPAWRAKVHEHHAYRQAQKKLLAQAPIGSVIRFRHAKIPEFILTSKRPFHGIYQGNHYRGAIPLIDTNLPDPGRHESKSEVSTRQAIHEGHAVRIAALQCENGQIHVLFQGKDGVQGVYMNKETYEMFPIDTICTIEDYATAGPLTPAPNHFSNLPPSSSTLGPLN